jgi:predicted Zn-dependent protease
VYVGLARLYLDAGAPDKARDELEKVLKVYPGNAHAKLVLAKTHVAENNRAEARRLLNDAAAAYADADEDYIYLAEVRDLLDELDGTPET